MKRRALVAAIALYGFLLGIHDGKIALWKGNDPEPCRVFPFSATLLPKEDQAALHKGIPINDQEQLRQLLEDFLS